MNEKMKRLEKLDVVICKMKESSGNEQFFLQLNRNDETVHGSILEYDCFQTKHLDKQQCLERAWFSASMVARFCGLSSMEDVILQNLTDEETEIIKKSFYIIW